MRGPEELLKHENRWETRMGGWFPNERIIYRGHDLHADLMDMSWMELYLYGITGRRFTEKELKVLNAIWVCTSYPDPRIWPNRVAALAGTARSTGTLGGSAAIAVSEATIYGGKAITMAIDFIIKSKLKVENGCKLSEILSKEEVIYGYGRPIIHIDERRPYLLNVLREAGMHERAHILLAFDIERFLLEKKGNIYLNYGGLIAAVAADMGFAPREYYLYCMMLFSAGTPPCFIDVAERNEGTFFPLRCDRISYDGVSRRAFD